MPATPARATAAVPSASAPANAPAPICAARVRGRRMPRRADILGIPPIQCTAVATINTVYSAVVRAAKRGVRNA